MLEIADVVVITAAEGEDSALLAVSDGMCTPWTNIEAPARYPFEVHYAEFESLHTPGRRLRVITSRPARLGTDHTGQAAGQLVTAYGPRVIAMCGVCAGRPEWTRLGDVIVGERVSRYDAGERYNDVRRAAPRFRKDTELYQLPATWLRRVENAVREWRPWPGDSRWLAGRPRPHELQALWLLKQLADGEDPAVHPEVETMCADWDFVTGRLEEEGCVIAGELTDAGRERLKRALFRNRGRLPQPAEWAIHAGPMATGNYLVRDIDIWDQLEDAQRLIRGFDMEVSVIGQTAWSADIPFLVVKGVMDYGLPERHRGFRPFAARAAAEVLLRLLRSLVEPVRPAASATTSEPSAAAAPALSGAAATAADSSPAFPSGPLSPESVQAGIRAIVEAMTRREGFAHARALFTTWPNDGTLPLAYRMRPHPLLSTYVRRDIDAIIEAQLTTGLGAVGVTGVVGMGGIGKTFLAMHVAQRFIERGYRVAWIGLLRKNIEGALSACAEAFGLQFRIGLSTREMQAGIAYLLNEHYDAGTKLLFVLDNAERFEGLNQLLDLCQGFPTLVTSRRREEKFRVTYHQLGTLNDAEVETYTRSFFDRYAGGYDGLAPAERAEIQELCRGDLGGHPLGIRLALTALCKLPPGTAPSRASRMRTVLATRSITVLEDDDTRLDGTGGAVFSRSVQACFDWLYAELLTAGGPTDREAHVLLPLISALAPIPLRTSELGEGVAALCHIVAADEPEPEDPEWLHALHRLRDRETRERAIGILVDFSLMDHDMTEGTLQVHPLVREYALHLLEVAEPLPGGGARNALRTAVGPTPLALARAVQVCVHNLTTSSEILFDLTPRLRKLEYRLEDYYRTIEKQVSKLYYQSYRWDDARRLLRETLAVVREKGVPRLEGRIMLELGEIDDRCSDPSGRTMIAQGLELLEKEPEQDQRTHRDRVWARAYLRTSGGPPRSLADVRKAYSEYRESLGDGSLLPQSRSRLGMPLDQAEGGLDPCGMYSLNAVVSTFLTNLVWDLEDLLAASGSARRDEIERIFAAACGRKAASSKENDCVSPAPLVEFKAVAVATRGSERSRVQEEIEREFEEVAEAARAAGLRSYIVQRHRLRTRLLWAAEGQDWALASRLARQWAEVSMLEYPHCPRHASRWGRIVEVLCRLCMPARPAEALAADEKALDAFESEAREEFSRTDVGWIMLGRALLAARAGRGHERAAVTFTVQARRTLRRCGRVDPIAVQVQRTIADLVDAHRPQFADLYDALYEGVAAVEVRPWSVSHLHPLPTFVRSLRTGRRMRLVHGGLQAGPRKVLEEPTDICLYPFYIDEVPFAEFAAPEARDTLAVSRARAREIVGQGHLRLPNRYEWSAFVWQWRHGGVPRTQFDLDDALERIASAVDGKVLVRYPLPAPVLPETRMDLSDDAWEAWFGARWIAEIEGMPELLERLFGQPGETTVTPDGAPLAIALANSLCFGPAELLELGDRVRAASEQDLRRLRVLLDEELEHWRGLWNSGAKARRGMARVVERRIRWWRLLRHESGRPSLARLRGVDFERVWIEERDSTEEKRLTARCEATVNESGRLVLDGHVEFDELADDARAACLFVHPVFTREDMQELVPAG